MLFLALVVLLSILLKLIWSHIISSRTKPTSALRLAPGPWQLPLIGSLHHFLQSRFSDLPHRALREMSSTYGPFMMVRMGAAPKLVVSSAEAARVVMKTHDLVFCDRNQSVTMDIISSGGKGIVFSPYNADWRELRKLCMVELLSQRRVLTFQNIREEEIEHLLRSISMDGQPTNLGKGIHCMISDAAARIILGNRCKYRDEYMHELHKVFRLAGGFSLADLYPSSWLVRRFSAVARETWRCHRNLYRIIQNIIHDREAMLTIPEREEDLLGVLFRLQREGGLQIAVTNEIVSAVIFDIFSAGSDTSSSILIWAMSQLVKHPHIMHKAQSEIRETFKGQEKITEGDLVKLRYLQLVIKETLRLHSLGPFVLPRKCRESCQVMGYNVPKGTMVLVNSWAISRDMRLWHDGKEFKPERFECSGIDFRGKDFEFTPFGAGRRICPCMTFGLAQVGLALASLLYHFDWDMVDGLRSEELDMAEAFGIVLRRKSALWLKAKPYSKFVPN